MKKKRVAYREPEEPNPYRPGAGHVPPFLAGRDDEREEFGRLLSQRPILTNLVLTGLRGVGKTVLLERFKPVALDRGWLWAATEVSESATVSEDGLATRLLADLAPLVSNVVVAEEEIHGVGFKPVIDRQKTRLDFALLRQIYDQTPGLASDKLKHVLEVVWRSVHKAKCQGIVLAYDEAQNLSNQAAEHQYPLSLLLDVFQSIQKKNIPVLLVLTGLPTLYPRLVNARTFAERMFRVITLGRLTDKECREAIIRPLEMRKSPVKFTNAAVKAIIQNSGGYPYFVQFLCREVYDACWQQPSARTNPAVTVVQSVRKLDNDFFAGRWHRVTDRQRELLQVVAELPNCNDEFTVQEIVEQSKRSLKKAFSPSHVSQLMNKLADGGVVYKNRHGRYCFAIPMMGDFINRQQEDLRSGDHEMRPASRRN